jgi:hypothetical protein
VLNTEGVHFKYFLEKPNAGFKSCPLLTSFFVPNPVGMANIVAADFNPPMNNPQLLLNPVGMIHIKAYYMRHPYGIQRKCRNFRPVD